MNTSPGARKRDSGFGVRASKSAPARHAANVTGRIVSAKTLEEKKQMKTTTTVTQYGAMALAGVLLLLQIVGGLEYTEGGSPFTKASMVLAMITLALLPVFIEGALRSKARGIAMALFVAFVAFLAYSLPATVGRTGEIKEVKVAEAKQSGEGRKLLEAELVRAQERLDLAGKDAKAACARASYSDNCKGWERTEKERQARVDALRKELGGAPAAKLGDTGSEVWAWALAQTGISAEAIRKGSVLSFGLGLDIVIWALVWFATSAKINHRRAARPANDVEPLPPAELPVEDPTEFVRAYRVKHGRDPQIKDVQQAFPNLSRTTSWRRLKAAS